MGVMRKNLFLAIALFSALCISVRAEVTPAQLTDPEFVINNGYSEITAEEIMISKQRAAGESVEPLYEKKHNKFVRFFQNCYSYIDPAVDGSSFYHHDIQHAPSAKDL